MFDVDCGVRLADDVTNVLTNCSSLVCCTPKLADEIVDRMRPRLEKFGGVCLVSDAQWVPHGDERGETEEP